jgi:hypothetical protein
VASIGLAAAAAVLLTWQPALALAGAAAGALVLVATLHPPAAAYILLGITPLVAGIDRDALIPLLRPNEALILLMAVPVVVRGAVHMTSGRASRLRVTGLDVTLVVLAVTSSVLPLCWMAARHHDITQDDVLYALTVWKYFLLYVIVRSSVRTESEVHRCLWISMTVASVVAAIGVLQALQLFGVPGLLAHYYAPFGDEAALEINRGTSTLASSFAMADVMTFNLAISAGWLARGGRPRGVLIGLSVLFVVGTLGSGQFSGVLGLLIGLLAVGVLTRTLTRGAVATAPLLLAGGAVMQPVLQARLAAFSTDSGLPSSWLARLDNLRRFFWPELAHYNWVLGVRPSTRVPAPHAEWWREWVWIESGHTWLLWNGGIPLFAAFFAFLWAGLRRTARVARERTDAIGVAAIATFAALAVVGVLTTFDPHLTLRGTADLLFALLALTFVAPATPQVAGAFPRDSLVASGP